MRNIILLISVNLLLFTVYGQAQEISPDKYQELSKRYITEAIYCFMVVYDSLDNPIDDIEKEGLNTFKNQFLYKTDWLKSDIDSILGKGWVITRDGLFKNYIELIVNDSSSFSNLLDYRDNSIQDKYKEDFYHKLDAIKESYTNELENLKSIEAKRVNDSASTQKEQLKKPEIVERMNVTQNKMLNFSGFIKWLFFIFLIVAIILLGSKYLQQKEEIRRLERSNKSLRKDLDWEKTKNANNKQNVKVKDDRSEKNILLEKEKVIEDKLTEDNEELTKRSDDKDVESESIELSAETEPVYESKHLFFESYEDGFFNNNQGKETQGTWDIYKLTTISENQGNIELLTHNEEEIISNRDVYLISGICDVTYKTGGLRNKFQETVPGKVRRDGEKWIVEQKIKVVIL